MEPIYYFIQIHVILHLDTAINVLNDMTNSMEPFISDSIFVVCFVIRFSIFFYCIINLLIINIHYQHVYP